MNSDPIANLEAFMAFLKQRKVETICADIEHVWFANVTQEQVDTLIDEFGRERVPSIISISQAKKKAQ